MKSFNLHLYAVTDSRYKDMPLVCQVEQAIIGGATIVQLREKHIDFHDYVKIGKDVKAVCEKYNVPFIINDNAQVARAVDSSGVHIGQSDMELIHAREILGKDKIIGVSANTVEEAIKAQDGGADYIGVGAIFKTETKGDVDVVGTARLGEIVKAINIPVVAIGGINRGNCKDIIQSNADGIAVVSDLFGSGDIAKAAKELNCWKDRLKA